MKKLILYHKRNIGTGEKYINELVYRHLINFTLEQLISKNLKNKLRLRVYFRKKSRLDKNIQLKNNPIDKRLIIVKEGLKPKLDIFSWILYKMSFFDINKRLL